MYKDINEVIDAMDFNSMLYEIKKVQHDAYNRLAIYENTINDLTKGSDICVFKAAIESRLSIIEDDIDYLENLPDIIYGYNIHTESIVDSVKNMIKRLWETIKKVLDKIWNFILKIVKSIGNFFRKLFGSASSSGGGGGAGGLNKDMTSFYTKLINDKLKNVDISDVLKEIMENFDETKYKKMFEKFAIGDEFIRRSIKYDLDLLHDVCVKYDLDMETFPIVDKKFVLGKLNDYGIGDYVNKLSDIDFTSNLLPDVFVNYFLPNSRTIGVMDILYTLYIDISEEGIRSSDENKVIIDDDGILISEDFPIVNLEASKIDDYKHHDGGRMIKFNLGVMIFSLGAIFDDNTDDAYCVYKQQKYTLPGKEVTLTREDESHGKAIDDGDKFCYPIIKEIEGKSYYNLSMIMSGIRTATHNEVEMSKHKIVDVEDVVGFDLFIEVLKKISSKEIDKFKRYRTERFENDAILNLASELAMLVSDLEYMRDTGAGVILSKIDSLEANIKGVLEKYKNSVEGKIRLASKNIESYKKIITDKIKALEDKKSINPLYINSCFKLLTDYSSIMFNINANIKNLVADSKILAYMNEIRIIIRTLMTGLFVRYMVWLIEEMRKEKSKTK